MEAYLSFKYYKIIADAGYESEENYIFLEENGQLAFIKPANYEISKKRKYKQDISRVENMEYIEERDCYICKNGKELNVTSTRRAKSRTGYISEKTLYSCSECSGCPYKKECIKGNNSKTPFEERQKNLSVSKVFKEKIKGDMGFRRFLSRGSKNVLCESILNAMAHNIKKLHSKIQNERTGTHLYELKKA